MWRSATRRRWRIEQNTEGIDREHITGDRRVSPRRWLSSEELSANGASDRRITRRAMAEAVTQVLDLFGLERRMLCLQRKLSWRSSPP